MSIARRIVTFLIFAAAICSAAPGQDPKDPQDTQFSHVFGGDIDDPFAPGYRIQFDRRGAGVRAIRLLDHMEGARGEPGDDENYLIVREELVDPTDPGEGAFFWMLLSERRRGASFPDLPGLGVESVWELSEQSATAVVFTLDGKNGLTLEKAFRYEPGRRDIIVEIAARAAADRPKAEGEIQLELAGVALVSPKRQYVLGVNPASAIGVDASADVDVDPIVTVLSAEGKRLTERPVLASRQIGAIDFAGTTNRFFAAFLYADDEPSSKALRRAMLNSVPERGQFDTPPFTLPVADFAISMEPPEPGQETRLRYRVYVGPKSFRAFEEFEDDYGRFELVVRRDLDPPCFCTVPGAQTMAYFLTWLLSMLQSFVGSWGLAIVVLTIIVRSALVPVNFRMQKSMRAYGAKMTRLKPKLDAIQKKYADDRQELQKHMVALQREHKLFPPIGGCLPMFVTIPVFIGLFSALRTSYELRHQPFMAWINDLSEPDRLLAIPWGFPEYFNLLPFLMVGLWWWLQAGTPLPSDPQQRQVMKIMRFMPLMFGVLLYNYASGLMVYMITSSCYALVEQRVTRRILGPVSPEAAGIGTMPAM